MNIHAKTSVQHVVIIVKENHTFDNYFGTFPNVNGVKLPHSSNPPLSDPDHRHSAWLARDRTSVRQQFVESDIPMYFQYARQFTLCDNYFTEVAGPSTPNHLMLLAADSPFIDNPSKGTTGPLLSTSLPQGLDNAGLSWANYGGYAFQYLQGLTNKNKFTPDQFKTDASAGTLPHVSWLYAPPEFDEHPPYAGKNMGNVTLGMQWTVDQINAVVQGGLWDSSVVFITWDDWGGWYDHVTPSNVETWVKPAPVASYKNTQFRYGSRVGCLILGPYVKQGYVSKILHSHVSLLKFCEIIYGLPMLNQRDGESSDMMDCFDWTQTPLAAP